MIYVQFHNPKGKAMKQTIRRILLVRILAVILTAVVASGNVTPVYAAQKSSAVTKAGPLKELTGLRVAY